MPPMQPLGALIAPVLQQAGLASKVTPEECQLLLKGEPLDLGMAVRFANIPASAKITLKTGHEPVLGVREAAPAAPKPAAPPAAPARAPAPEAPSTSNPADPAPPLSVPAPAPFAAAPAAPPATGASVFAGREVFVFTREAEAAADAAAAAAAAPDLSEEDYEVTEADVRVQLAAYASRRAAAGAKPLMTRQMREAEAARKAAAFGPVPVRVEFPEGTVLQAAFAASAPLAELHDLVRAALTPQAAAGFYLFTTPPKTELKDVEVSFYSAGLVPAARVHVGFRGAAAGGGGQGCLRPEVLAMVGEPPSRAAALGTEHKKKEAEAARASGSGSGQAPAGEAAQGQGPQGAPKRAKPGGLPAWMKLSSG